MDRKVIAEICNKLQAPKMALELFLKGKDKGVPKEFIEMALKELDKIVELLRS